MPVPRVFFPRTCFLPQIANSFDKVDKEARVAICSASERLSSPTRPVWPFRQLAKFANNEVEHLSKLSASSVLRRGS